MSPTVATILITLSILGTTGNSLVLYVYGRKKDKLTSTFFILILATTDFVTCLVIVPFTVIVEYLQSQLFYDFPCRLYHFLITSNIPFSCFVMVAIAFDRYFCICWPLKRIMTIEKAKLTVIILVLFATSLGIIPTLSYGIITNEFPSTLSSDNETNSSLLSSSEIAATAEAEGLDLGYDLTDSFHNMSLEHRITADQNITLQEQQRRKQIAAIMYDDMQNETVIGICLPVDTIVSEIVREVYRIIYAILFLVSILLVSILYVLLFLTVRRRRLAKMKRSKQFELATKKQVGLIIMTLNTGAGAIRDVEESECDNGETETSMQERETSITYRTEDATNGDAKTQPSSSSYCANPNAHRQFKKISAKERQANIRTAIMLFVVTLVFIITFLPAFLMAYGYIDYNPIVFYLYFAYNVANPMIYCFMNEAFRHELILILKCERQRQRRRRRRTK